jgi:RHS repeat-associated protein
VSDQITALASGSVKVVPLRDNAGRVTGFQWGNAAGNFVPALTQTWQRGPGGRIEYAGSDVAGAPSFDYLLDSSNPKESFDSRGRRLKCETAGGIWTYTYGVNGQLERAVHRDSSNEILLGDFQYSFDAIGRRTDKGADNFDDLLDTALLNQTTAWANSQIKKITVTANPAARVWINGVEVQDFDGSKEHPIELAENQPHGWVEWHTLAILEGAGEGAGNPPANPLADPDAKSEKRGAVWVPPTSETLDYDDAGNRQENALWDYGWDAKNQLVRVRTKDFASAPQGWDIRFTYDAEGRRLRKHVIELREGERVAEKEVTYLWDGWDLLYERHQLPSGLTTLERKYLWGPDILDGAAGGAGGLLLIFETKGNTTTGIIPLYDGTGHVVALTNLNKDLLATYAYGPFGEKISATGPLANSNPWRWGTKYIDEETGLYYFGHRYYDPVTCQWLSRELLGESESVNLYQFCHNDPINAVDVLGLFETQVQVDSLRTDLLLGQLLRDPTKLPLAPPQEALDLPALKYSPNAEKFGLFQPYSAEDYDRTRIHIQNLGQPMIRPSTWEEAEAARGPRFVQPEWIPHLTSSQTLGAANTQLNASLNSGFIMPSGGGAFAFGLVKNVQLLKLLQTGARSKLGEVLNPAFAGRPGFASGMVRSPLPISPGNGPGLWQWKGRRGGAPLIHQANMTGKSIRVRLDGVSEIEEYVVGGTAFDDFVKGTLIDHKSKMPSFLFDSNDLLKTNMKGPAAWRAEALRQVKAANGIPVEWVVSPVQVKAFDSLLQDIPGITVHSF